MTPQLPANYYPFSVPLESWNSPLVMTNNVKNKFYSKGECHGQADAEWIVIKRPLWGRNDTPFGRTTPGRPVGRPGAGHPKGVFGVLS
jgi:hypothetical protein